MLALFLDLSQWNRCAVPGLKPIKRFFTKGTRKLRTTPDAALEFSVLPKNLPATNNAPPGRIQNRSNVAALILTTFPAVDATERNRNCLRFG
jgi:hypothetical protein